jgi:hypothetical protein
MKLLVDLLPCQTDSRFRGIGRYTLSLVREMTKVKGSNELYALADLSLSKGFEELRQEFIRLLPAGCFLPYYHGPVDSESANHQQYVQIAETLIRQAYQTISPDIVLTPSPFEMNVHGVVPYPN